MQVRLLGPVELVGAGGSITVGGPKERALLTALALRPGEVVSEDALVDILWGEAPPRTAVKTLRSYISRLRRAIADADGGMRIDARPGGYVLDAGENGTDVDEVMRLVNTARGAAANGDADWASVAFAQALRAFRGRPLGEFADDAFARADAIRLEDLRQQILEERIDADLASGRHAALVGELEALTATFPLRERLWAQRMVALYRSGRQAEALRVYQELRRVLGDELGIGPSPALVQLEADILQQRPSLDWTEPVARAGAVQSAGSAELPSGVVTFLLTDIEGSTALWDANAPAMADALAAHDRLIASLVADAGGSVLKARGEGDATLSVFRRASDATAAALALQRALDDTDWPEGFALRVRVAMHTGEAFERDGDYFGPTLNRAARLRSIASGGQILASQATAELIADHLPAGTELRSMGEHQLRGLSRREHVFEVVVADDRVREPATARVAAGVGRPALAPALAGMGVFVGRDDELDQMVAEWDAVSAGAARVVLIAGEPGVGKTRLAAEWARRVDDQGALVLYGRCDEDLGTPYQPFAEAARSLIAVADPPWLRAVRGIEELARLAPELSDVIGTTATPTQADPDTERSLLFDAVAQLFAQASAEIPVLLVMDDLHWAAKPTVLLLRHVLRANARARLHVVATYRTTDLSRAHPLAAALTDLSRETPTLRLTLSGLDVRAISAYLAAAGYDDAGLGNALAEVTSGNPFFLIEVLRHVQESGGHWNADSLPQGVREAIGRRLTRLSETANEALTVAAVAGGRFSLGLIEAVLDRDLLEPIDECRRAGLVVEERGDEFRFNHALVRNALLTEMASIKRIRLHERIATALESGGPEMIESHLADLARHWFECALAGGASKAVDYARRAGEQAMARLAYEEAADLFGRALDAADVDGSGCDDVCHAELLRARCEAGVAAADPTIAQSAVNALLRAAGSDPSLDAWAKCYSGQVAILTQPERLDVIAAEVADAAAAFAAVDDAEGEAAALTVRAACLVRTGRIAESEAALDRALGAARRAGSARRINAVLAGAPTAALWGPSPVARASGRCLDVVRVLRITTASPAVEAVALRCQAVLEALRGRADAARRMLASARQALETLGHVHGLLELDVAAGLVELYAGDVAAAATALLRAYDGFAARQVGADAALAAALLGRCRLAAGAVDEALELTARSEELAGADLQAGIAWRCVRAEALAAQGLIVDALEAARAAVALADPTDALVDQGDAHLALSVVQSAAGDHSAARREASRARELYSQKGATARADAVDAASPAPIKTSAAGDPTPSGYAAFLQNAAVDAYMRINGLVRAHDLEGLAEAGGDVIIESRRLVGSTIDFRAMVESFYDLGFELAEAGTIATRGDRLALTFARTANAEGTYVDVLFVIEVDAHGAPIAVVSFDVDAEAAAYEELDRRYLAGEGAQYAAALRPLINAVEGYNERDWRKARGQMRDDFIGVDRRPPPAPYDGLGPDDFVATLSRLIDEAPTLRLRTRAIAAFAQTAALALQVGTAALPDGGRAEIAFWAIYLSADAKLRTIEMMGVDAYDEALARFNELTSTTERAVGLRNDAFSAFERVVTLFLNGRRYDGIAEIAGATKLDSRRLTGASIDFVSMLRSFDEMGVRGGGVQPVATRGADLALLRPRVELEAGTYVEALFVVRTDGDGRITDVVSFDENAVDDAYAELDARYLAAADPALRHSVETILASASAYNRRDWRTARELIGDDCVVIDHRPPPSPYAGATSPDQFIDTLARLMSEAPLTIRMPALHRIAPEAGLCSLVATAQLPDGGSAELGMFCLWTLSGRGYRNFELFGDDQFDEACARFEDLCVYLHNRAYNAIAQVAERFADREWEGAGELCTDDVLIETHRLTAVDIRGRAAAVEYLRSAAEVGVRRLVVEPLAARGERLVLVRLTGVGEHAETELLHVFEVDHEGRIQWGASFEPSKLDDGLAALDERYHASPDGLRARSIPAYLDNTANRVILRIMDLVAAGDFDTALSLLAPDASYRDYRRLPGGYSLEGADGLAAVGKSLAEVGAVLLGHEVLATRGDRLALNRAKVGDAASFVEILSTVEVDEDGRLVHTATFDVDDLDAAYEELDARYIATTGFGTDHAAHAVPRVLRLYNTHDWTTLCEEYTEDFVLVDHRPLGWGTLDRDRWIAHLAGIVELVPDVRLRVLAVPEMDDRSVVAICSGEGHGTNGNDFAMHYIGVVEYDGKQIACIEVFGEDDLTEACQRFGELRHERAFNDAGWRPVQRLMDGYNNRDWDGMLTASAADCMIRDERMTGWGTLDREGFIERVQDLVGISPDVQLRCVRMHVVRPTGVAAQFQVAGNVPGGGEFTMSFEVAATIRDGVFTSLTLLPEGHAAEAVQRLELVNFRD